MSYRILHIADPHFTQCHCQATPPSEIGCWHAREVEKQLRDRDLLKSKMDAIILSGDFTYQYRLEGFEAAEAFIECLAPLTQPHSFVVIPGNHDVNIGTPYRMGNLSLPIPRESAERHYRNFVTRISKHVAPQNRCLSMVQRLSKKGLPGLILAGLNSCRVERSDAQGWGYVGQDQIRDLIVGLLNGAVKAHNDDLLLVISHHNLLPVWDVGISALLRTPEQRSFSFTIDAPSIMDILADLGASILLHGHAHVASVKHVHGYGRDVARHDRMLVLGTGSLGFHPSAMPKPREIPVEATSHHIQVLDIEADQIRSHDLTCQAHTRNHERIWAYRSRKLSEMPRIRWQKTRAERALKMFEWECELNQIAFENLESWSRLVDLTGSFDEILPLVSQLGKTLTRAQLSVCIDSLKKSPPQPADIDGLTLQEYLFKHC